MEGSHREVAKSAINRKQGESLGTSGFIVVEGTTPGGGGATTKEKHGIDDLSSLRAFLCKDRIEKSRDSRCLTRLRLLASKTKAKS